MLIKDLGSRGAIRGDAADGYGPVVDTFVENFVVREEVGAAVVLYVTGRKVVDLWGGLADARSGRAWTADTPALVFSCTKGILAICTYVLVQDDRLDLDAPVIEYWPEFGAHGKAATTVRMLLSHCAGLPALDTDLTLDDVLAWDPVIRAIESQRPLWEPGTAHSYHTLTYGWLVGEVIRRVTGQTPGTFFREAIAAPLGLRAWIGLPPSEREKVAWMEPPLPDGDPVAGRALAEFLARPAVARAATMGGAFAFPHAEGMVTFNDPRIQAAEIPGANGISTVESLARLYAACVSEIDGTRILSQASVEDALTVQSQGRQESGLPDMGERWGTGFQLDSPPAATLLGPRSFGHDGAGGLRAFGDDEYAVGFAYLHNQMGGVPDNRANSLTTAVRTCLGA